MIVNRRGFLIGASSFVMLAGLGTRVTASGSETMEVFKSATCGCCKDWIAHVEEAGFVVTSRNVEQDKLTMLKRMAGVPDDLAGCHTARIAGYVIEGHVPAADIKRLLQERPDAVGLSVPGMPFGSPGMGPEDQREAYDVVLIRRDGGAAVFTAYPAAA